MVFQNDILAGSSGTPVSSVYKIDQSIRFNDDDSAYLSKTWSGAGDKQKFTFSFWVKRGNITSRQILLSFRQDVPLEFEADDTIRVYLFGTTALNTNRVFRDPSAWYHIVLSVDSTQAVAPERVRLYVNGVRETSFSTASYPSVNASANIYTSTLENYIGRILAGSNYFDGYMAEIHFLDGLGYDPSYFGLFNENGIWIPKEYSGSYGTNGYKIDGRDSSDLGDDESGNGNDFTTNGLNAHDQVADSPTNNFCVMNPNNTHSSMTLANGNLQSNASSHSGSGGTILLPSTGKWYAEFRYNSGLNNEYPVVGVYNPIKRLTTSPLNPGLESGDLDFGVGVDGRRNEDGTKTTSWSNTITNGKIGAIAIDMTNKKIWFGHNNSGSFVWQGSGDPSSGTNEANTKDFNDDLIFGNSHYQNSNMTWNFGQDGTFAGTETAQNNSDANGVGNFYYAPPTGYLALCTKNMGG